MINETCQRPGGPAVCVGATLNKIWRVDADQTYNVTKPYHWLDGLLAVRTISGEGIMEIESHAPFHLLADGVILVEMNKIKAYRTAGDRWNFWWFEFDLLGPLHFPLHTTLNVPADPREQQDLQDCYDGLPSHSFPARALASSVFATLLYRWTSHWHHASNDPKSVASIVARTAERMRKNMSRPSSIEELAQVEQMGVRWFRKLFVQHTGIGPKQYYNALRLDTAAELLRMGGSNITQISEKLGFSSPFHLSRAFRKRFGTPPSLYVSRNNMEIDPQK